eukprot:scaffold8866_cov150-Skeletonema_marinoi.AAC.2
MKLAQHIGPPFCSCHCEYEDLHASVPTDEKKKKKEEEEPPLRIAGGVLTDGTSENTPEGDAEIEAAIASLSTGGVTESADERTIDSIDCAGLTGENCCLLIKLKIRESDADANGNDIQLVSTTCFLDEEEILAKPLRLLRLLAIGQRLVNFELPKFSTEPYLGGGRR